MALIRCECEGASGAVAPDPPKIDQKVAHLYTRNCSIFTKEH